MIIEFFGLPGAGKSTIARELAKNSDWQIVKIKKRSELIFYNLKFLVKQPFKFFKLFCLVLKNSKSLHEFYYKFMNCFLDYNAKYEKAKKYKQAILDQGYFQNIISLFSSSLEIKGLKKFIKTIMLPDRLFIIDLNNSERILRLGERGYGVRSRFGKKDSDIFLRLAEKNTNFFIKNIKILFKNSSLIDSGNELQKILKQIQEIL